MSDVCWLDDSWLRGRKEGAHSHRNDRRSFKFLHVCVSAAEAIYGLDAARPSSIEKSDPGKPVLSICRRMPGRPSNRSEFPNVAQVTV